jgi:2-dehydropantoate 2-reductase
MAWTLGMPKFEFAILGAGAMGSILGAHLVRAGHSVAMLVRERRAREIETQGGLRIRGLVDFATPVHTITQPAELAGADVLIVTTKAIDTAASLEPLRAAEIGTAFSIQNGVMKNELLGTAFSRAHVLGALANFSGEMLGTGEVVFTRNVNLMIGDLSGPSSARASEIARTIDAAGVRSTAVENIRGHEWSKFAAWVGLAAVSVTTRSLTSRFLLDAGAALVVVRLIREVGALAAACNIELTDESMFPVATLCQGIESAGVDIIRAHGAAFQKNAPTHRMSTLQDLEAHRPLELDETFGFAVRHAAELGLKLPLTEAFYHLARAIDRGARQ